MATETKLNYNQTRDNAHGTPIREQISVYLMPDVFSIHPVAQLITFNMTFYVGSSMKVAARRHGKTHRLIGIFAHEDGPDPIDIVINGSARWGTRAAIRDSFRAALRAAILEKLQIDEEAIEYLDKIISDVTRHDLNTSTDADVTD